jgi:peptidoglycan/LPS O-acetylase OafA/YrhL
MIASPAPKMHTLDAMRGIAAFVVAAFHAGLLTNNPQSPYLAVDFFFVLSGFVIAHAYDARLAGGMTVKEFIGRRLLRLYPLFALGLTLGLVVALIDAAFSFGREPVGVLMLQFIAGLLFLPYPAMEPEALIVPLNGPYWSLILEMQINVIFAIAFAWLSLRVVGAVAAACALAIVGVSYALGTLETGFLMSDYLGGVARVGFSFSAGVLLSRLRHRIYRPKLHWSILLAITAALLVIPKPAEVRWLYDTVCVIILFPLLILAGTQSEPSSPKLLRMFLLVGSFSYALYAIHTPVLHFGHVLAEMNPEQPYKLLMMPFFALACGAAVAADLLYDRPVRKMIAERLSERQRRRMKVSQGGAFPKD